MKHKINKMSIYQLKLLFSQFLQNKLNKLSFDVLTGYEAIFSGRLCSLKIINHEKIKIKINLNYVKQSFPIIDCSLRIRVVYCCLFIFQYLMQLESAKHDLPESYFKGLTLFTAIEIFNENKAINIYSPIFQLNTKKRVKYYIRQIEMYCAIKTLDEIVTLQYLELDKHEKRIINIFKENLLSYSHFPEISYFHKKKPAYTIIESLKNIAKQIERSPYLVQCFPILSLPPFNNIKNISIKDFFLKCTESNNDFLIGIAIRLVTFLDFTYTLDYSNNVTEKLINEMKKYISNYAKFHNKIFIQGNCFYQDNFFAVKKAIKAINRFLCMNNITVSSGNIHFII